MPSSRRRIDGVEDDAMIQHERAVKFSFLHRRRRRFINTSPWLAPRRDDAHSFTRDARVKLSEDDGSLLSAWSPDSQARPAGRRSLVSQPSTLSVRSRCSTPVERRRQATREATNPQRLRAANAKLKKRQAARDVLYLYERRDAVSLRRRRVVSHPTQYGLEAFDVCCWCGLLYALVRSVRPRPVGPPGVPRVERLLRGVRLLRGDRRGPRRPVRAAAGVNTVVNQFFFPKKPRLRAACAARAS